MTDAIKKSPTGTIFNGIDMINRRNAKHVVVKEGRAYCLSDEFGRDIRTRLKSQQKTYESIMKYDHKARVPKILQYLEAKGNGYLVTEYIKGESIDLLAGTPLALLTKDAKLYRVRVLRSLIKCVQGLHKAGLVHRDITPNNILMRNGKVWLVDFELSAYVGSKEKPFKLGTPGFMSPQQEHTSKADFSDDIYALGATMIHIMTGLDTMLFIVSNNEQRNNKLQLLITGAPKEFIQMLSRTIDANPKKRPTLISLMNGLDELEYSLTRSQNTNGKANQLPFRITNQKKLLTECQKGILISKMNGKSGLWES
ncbi:MAG: protein kinase domain-containing protein, partial [Rhabdochlamydiaceae bacterium]